MMDQLPDDSPIDMLPPEQITVMTRMNQGYGVITMNMDQLERSDQFQKYLQAVNINNSKEIQTDNQTFLEQIIRVIKDEILEEIESEKQKYSIKEYEILLKRTRDIIEAIKRKYYLHGDIFVKSAIGESGHQLLYQNQKSPKNRVMSMSPRQKLKIEEMFNVKIKTRVGGAGKLQRYYEIKDRKKQHLESSHVLIGKSPSAALP